MDLSNSVILPREDFIELQEVAYNQHTTLGERAAQSLQTTIFCGALAAAVTAGAWGWAKAVDWRETRKFNRDREMLELTKPATQTPKK